ncbi:MAG: aldehyde dehydrogenase family protein [Acidimicrobiia bacterium]|nr:MAG: aldehyde dehydrogenase family protein [Acidimicrobiia bacterium]
MIVEANVDRALGDLAAKKDEWARLSVRRKLEYLQRLRKAVSANAEEWVDISLSAKRIPDRSPLAGEEWISGPYAVLLLINALTKSLEAVDSGSDVLAGTRIRTRAGGQVVVEVFPGDIYDRLLLNGYRAEVWMQEGVTPANLRDHVASFYKEQDPAGRIGLILGAGNISSIPVLDILTKMFIEGQVAIVKMNPINDYLGAVFEEVCRDLIDAGFLRFVYGGGDVGAYLTSHHLVDTLHITGSADTYNKIVFGGGEAGADRRSRNEPLITKPFTSELGGVGPTFIVPGPWTDADLTYQAEHLATQKFHNAGFNCIASQVLVLPGGWSGSDRLVDELRRTIRSIPAREAYYPGADERQQAAVAKHPHAELLDAGPIPRTLITDVDASGKDEYAFTTEFFGGVYATTKLDTNDPAEFVPAAVEFANKKLAGTLGAQFIIHPKTRERIGPVLDQAIADLNYGSVGVNGWTGAGYLLPTATWGAYPGHTHDDIGSGMGVVHNAYMFDWPEKTVVHAPFHPFPRALKNGQFHLSPKPPWFVTHRRADKAGERLTRFAADPGWRHLPGIFAAALRH